MTDSNTLLSQYARTGSESAFQELVSRYLDLVYSTAFPTARTVDKHIASLRSKIERDPDASRWLKTVHCVGYQLDR